MKQHFHFPLRLLSICLSIVICFGALPFALPAMAESIHYSYADIVRRLYDMSELTKIPQDGESSDQFSSYDRSSQYDESNDCYLNWGANKDGTGYLYETEDSGLVIAEMDGPGYISRMWLPYTTQSQIKIYIDGSDTPVIDTPYINLVYGMFKQYDALSFNTAPIQTNTTSGSIPGGFDSYVPITYNQSCRVVMYGEPTYYLISYTTLSQGSTVESFTSTMSDTNKNALQTANDILNQPSLADSEAKQVYQNTVEAGSSVDLYTASGSGAVRYMNLDIDIPAEEFDPQTSLCDWSIAMYWDGSAQPSVNMTVADFFGTPYGNTAYASYVMGVNEDGSMYCRWYMPYANGAKIVLTNNSDTARTVSLSLASETVASAENLLRFNASWQRMEELSGDRYPDAQMLYVEGSGRFVGTVLHVCQFAENYWWGEGDEKFFVDGEKFPSWYGTGSEDYFGYAWSDKGIFVTPFIGQTVCNNDLDTAFPQGAGDKVNYRFHLTDNIPFFSSFDAYMEKYAQDIMTAYGVTTFFYLTPGTQSNYIATSPDMEQRIFNTLTAYDAPTLTYKSLQIINHLGDYSDKVPVTQDMSVLADLFGLEWTDNIQVFWQSSSAGNYFEFSVNLPESSIYDLSAEITKAADYGTFIVSIDGITIGTPYDCYSPNVTVAEHSFGTIFLTQGTHTVRITTAERNSASAADFIGISKVEFSKPDWDVYYEGGSDLLNVLKDTSEGVAAHCQPLGAISPNTWSEDQHLWITTTKPEDYAAFELSFPMSGLYDVTVSATTAGDYGAFAVYLDGQKIGEDIDTYGTVVTSKEFSLGSVAVTAGTHALKIISTGKNEASAGYFIGIDDILFSANNELVQAKASAIEDIQSYKDFDNYDTQAQKDLNSIIQTTISSILEAINIDSIESILTSAKAEMDKIEPIPVYDYDIDVCFEGSTDLIDALLEKSSSEIELHSQPTEPYGDLWSENAHAWITTNAPDDYLDFELEFPISNRFEVEIGVTCAVDYGIFEVYLDGELLGSEIDGYASTVTRKIISLGTVEIAEGTHFLQIYCTGTSDASSGYYIGIDDIIFKGDQGLWHEKVIAVETLTDYKDTYKNSGNYYPEQQEELDRLFVNGSNEIYGAINETRIATELTAAKASMDAVKTTEQVDQEEAEQTAAVKELISALPSSPTTTDRDAIQAARQAYDALTDRAKALVDNYTLLETAESILANLDNQAAADAVIAQINLLPSIETVTADDKQAIEAARSAYNGLTEAQKVLVNEESLNKLIALEEALAAFNVDCGDINNDGSINAADALLALQHSVKLTTLEGEKAVAADVNKDGLINATDALYILQYSVKLIDKLPVA